MNEVTDGKMVFDDYYFHNGQIYTYGNRNPIKFFAPTGIAMVSLYQDGKYHNRSLQKLKRWSCPDPKLRRLLKRVERDFVPVYGFEDKYKFNPKNPNEVFNIEKRYMKSIIKTKYYDYVAIKDKKGQNLRIHQMVMEYYLQKHIDTDRFEVHHLNHDSFSNNISNLIILPCYVHDSFEGHYKRYKNMDKSKNYYSKQDMINLINKYKISETDKKRLIDSL